jgi:PAS domain S-box-containing protein
VNEDAAYNNRACQENVVSESVAHRPLSADESLQQTVAQHRAILASALDPIVIIDAQGIIQSASNSLHRVFGWQPHEVIGRNISMLMPEPHRSAHDGYLARYRRTKQTNIMGRTREFEAVRKDGLAFPIELSVSRVDIPGRDEALFMGIIHDITDRRRLEYELALQHQDLERLVRERTRQLEATHEQLRQADRLASIGTLAAGLGHDMNNVLLPIRARLDALDAIDLPSTAREQFVAVRQSIAYLQQLSDGLHLLALDADDPDASSGRTNLTQWWSQVGPLLVKGLPKRVAMQCDIDADLPDVAVAPHRLTQAVLNLVVNAGEAVHDEGLVRVWAKGSSDRRMVRIGVTDTGEGMTPNVKRHAMDPFFTTKKRGLGTGLGLSLVRGVAQAARGSAVIDSEPGQGTTVTLNLPAAAATGDLRADGADEERVVSVSIADRRAASFVSAIVQAAGFTPRVANGDDPSHSRVWITEPQPSALQSARQYVRADRRRRLVTFGPASDEWATLGACVIADVHDFDAIRRAVGEALFAAFETNSHP